MPHVTRFAVTTGLAAALFLAPLASASPPPRGDKPAEQRGQMTDPAGDWQVPWQDIVAGRLSGAQAKDGSKALSVTLTMAAPLGAGMAGDYDVVLGMATADKTCRALAFGVAWTGSQATTSYRSEGTSDCGHALGAADVQALADGVSQRLTGTGPVVTVKDATLTFVLSAPAWLTPGAPLQFSALASPATPTLIGVNGVNSCDCDVAFAHAKFGPR